MTSQHLRKMSNTIVAVATATGLSSISIIRLSGDNALKIAKKISKKDKIKPRYATLSSIYNRDNILIDQAIIIYFVSPNSFTGEDIIEFQSHGGLIIAQEIIETCLYYGASLAKAGEFSKRAFLNGKIDLTKAEAIAKLIEAKSIDATKILAKQLKGELKNFIDESREMLLKALAYNEVLIDYAEEDIPNDIMNNLISQLNNLSKKIEKIVEVSYRRKGLIEGFKVSIIGKPNVGKSSLLNSLLNYDRAIVSNIAGTTRDTIEEQIRIGSHIIRIIDTAGIRDAKNDIEKIGVERSLKSLQESDIIIALFDGNQDIDKEDNKIIEILNKIQDKYIIVAINKFDLKQRINKDVLSKFNPINITAKEENRVITDKLLEILNSIDDGEELMLISTRQIEAVIKAKKEIDFSIIPLKNGELEFFSYHLQEAIKEISSISRPYNNSEVLDKMFGEFCLGK